MTVLPDLSEHDTEALLHLWPNAHVCPVWRLWGESPSVGLMREIRSGAVDEQALRDGAGRLSGLLDVREVNDVAGSAYLAFIVPAAPAAALGTSTAMLSYLREVTAARQLRKVTVMVDEDMLDAVAGVMPHVAQVGLLQRHALASVGRYVDRHVFEFTSGPGPA